MLTKGKRRGNMNKLSAREGSEKWKAQTTEKINLKKVKKSA